MKNIAFAVFAAVVSIVSPSSSHGQALPDVTGVYVQNRSAETIKVGLLFTFIDRDGFVYNRKAKTLLPGQSTRLDAGGADQTKTYYLVMHSQDHNKFVHWGNHVPGAKVHQAHIPNLKKWFDGFGNKYVAVSVQNGDFAPLLKFFASHGNIPATRVKPTGGTKRISVTYSGRGNGSIHVR